MIISVTNHKGGVGKTTTVSSLGASLAECGKRVLLVDLDPQGNLTDTLSEAKAPRTIHEALLDQSELPILKVQEGLDLVPSNIDLASADIEFGGLNPRERNFRLWSLIEGLSYDYILIDCPPSLGLLTTNALFASDKVLIPTTAEALPTHGLRDLLRVIDIVSQVNKRLSLGGIVLTRVNRKKIGRIVETFLRESFGDLVFATRIRDNVDLTEYPLGHTDIFRYSPKSIGAEDYRALRDEILSKWK